MKKPMVPSGTEGTIGGDRPVLTTGLITSTPVALAEEPDMLNPDNSTPSDAYEVPLGLSCKTCRPTLYLGLSYLGVSGVVRPIVNAHVVPGTLTDFAIFGICATIALVVAQILEYKTRPLRRTGIAQGIRRDRAARMCNLGLGLGGIPTSLVAGGVHSSGHLVMVCLIAVCTVFGEVLYQSYGKKHPYRPTRNRSAAQAPRQARTG